MISASGELQRVSGAEYLSAPREVDGSSAPIETPLALPTVAITPRSTQLPGDAPSGRANRLMRMIALLSTQSVEAAAPYVRDAFGAGWKDPDRNGCDARNDTLAKELVDPTFRPGTGDCVVETGILQDPFTGATIPFVRGNKTSELVQIDHLVPLSYAWHHGAWQWSDEQRLEFANDPHNLTAVDGPSNMEKSDSGPSEWLPQNDAYVCTYLERFVTVLVNYGLTIDPDDRATIDSALVGC